MEKVCRTTTTPIDWNDERLKQLCSTVAMAFLSPVSQINRTQDSQDNFELRLKKLIDINLQGDEIHDIQVAVQKNSQKRSVDFGNADDGRVWEDFVESKFYERFKNRLCSHSHDIQNMLQIIHELLNCAISVTFETCNYFHTYRHPSKDIMPMPSKLVKLSLYAKTVRLNDAIDYKFKFMTLCDLLSEPELIQLSSSFTRKGVQFMLVKIRYYEAVCMGDKEKAGKWADALGKLVGGCLGGSAGALISDNPAAPRLGSSIASKISDLLIKNYTKGQHKDKAKQILKIFQNYEENEIVYRKVFLKAFVDIFAIYERQFVQMRASCEHGETYIKLLSLEIVGRIMNYLSSSELKPVNPSIEADTKILRNYLVQAAISGSSKLTLLTEITKKLPILQYFNDAKLGVDIKELRWRSHEVFEQPGIVDIDRDRFYNCASKANSENIDKYGFRRVAFFEQFDENGVRIDSLLFRTRFEQIILKDSKLAYDYRLGTDIDKCNIFDRALQQLIENDQKSLQLETYYVGNDTNEITHRIDTKLDNLITNILSESPVTAHKPIQFGVSIFKSIIMGRDKDVINVHNSLNRQNIVRNDVTDLITVICGLGGIGKTTLAEEVLLKYRDEYDGNVIWINAGSEVSIYNAFKSLGQSLFTEVKSDIDLLVQAVYDSLEGRKYLIVFDNVENETEEDYDGLRFLFKYLPSIPFLSNSTPKTSILITSRLDNWDPSIDIIRLKELAPDDSKSFILDSCKTMTLDDPEGSADDAYKLGMALQGLPLALQSAVAYIKQVDKEMRLGGSEMGYTIGNYLDDLEDNGKELLNHELSSEALRNTYKNPVLRTWLVTMKRINKTNPSAIRLLHCVSYMIPDGTPTSWFNQILGSISIRVTGSCIVILEKYSMISVKTTKSEDIPQICIHRMLQQAVRLSLNNQSEKAVLEDCFSILRKQMSEKFTSSSQLLDCISNVQCVWNYIVSGGHTQLIQSNASFTVSTAQQLFNKDRLYPCIRFCNPLIKTILRSDMHDFVVANDAFEIMKNIQKKLFPKFTIQGRWVNVFISATNPGSGFNRNSKKSYMQFLSSSSSLCVRFIDDKHPDYLDQPVISDCVTNVYTYLKNQVTNPKSSITVGSTLSCEKTSPKELEKYGLFGFIIYNDVFSFIMLLLFPLMTYDYSEEDLSSALCLFEYLNERFSDPLKACPLLQVVILQCTSFCWFGLRARPAAIEPLRTCVRILQKFFPMYVGSIELLTLTTTIKYLRTSEHSEEIDTNLRKLIGIEKKMSNVQTEGELQIQLFDFFRKILDIVKVDN